MSLLLEALKKAERAKQDKAGATNETTTSATDDKGLSPLDTPTQPMEPPPAQQATQEIKNEALFEKLPSLELSLEEKPEVKPAEPEVTEITYKPEPSIPPLDLHPASAVAKPAPEPASEAQQRVQRRVGKREFSAPKQEPKLTLEQPERIAARTLFDAKKPARKSSAPFLAIVAVLLVIMMGAGYYYWSALSPNKSFQSTMVQTPPLPIRPQGVVEPVNTSAATTEPAKTGEPILANNPTIEKPIEPNITTVEKTPAVPVAQPEINNGIKINRSTSIYVLSSPLANGYKSYVSGDLDTAEQQYRQALQIEPANRDAYLGLAAIAVQREQSDNAEALYLKLLELDPRDAAAQAGLINLRGQTDTSISESRIKNLLAQQPDSGALNFALGNLYATQSRWGEAQQAYFRAYSSDSENPDYIYNLAVSLDHLNQSKLALEYYQRALTLAGKRPVSFDKKYLVNRIKDLS
jgi:tetratricopeptide (TPR) repeat protein